MARKPKPSHVVELPLDVNAADARRLLGVFTAGSRLNNVLLQDGLRILEAVRADPGWAAARALPRKTDEQRKARQTEEGGRDVAFISCVLGLGLLEARTLSQVLWARAAQG